jgi:N-acyl-D-amino-acid deacylase
MDPNSRARVLEHIRNVLDVRGGPARIVIISSPDHRFDGKDIAQIGSDLNVSDPGETILKLIEDFTGEISIISRSMIDEDIVKIMKTDYVMIATDGYSISPHGPSAVGIPHPRSYGTYPRVLGHYSRELKLITLEDAVRKMTSLPARKFHLACRGILKEGNWADIVVFDSSTIIDRSTFASPAQYPEGIDYVLVNGAVVVDNKNNSGHTGERAGKVLKLRNGYVN